MSTPTFQLGNFTKILGAAVTKPVESDKLTLPDREIKPESLSAGVFDSSNIVARGFTATEINNSLGKITFELDKRISLLQKNSSGTKAEELMKQYTVNLRKLVESQENGQTPDQELLKQLAKIEVTLCGKSKTKLERFEEFKFHIFRLARDMKDPNYKNDIDNVVSRVTTQLPTIFIPRHSDRGSRSHATLASRHAGRNFRRGSPFGPGMEEITVENAMTAIDAMVQADFPIQNREKAIAWIATFMAESKLNSYEPGDGGLSKGIGQIYKPAHSLAELHFKSWDDRLDPYKCMQACKIISKGWRDIGPWHAYPKRGEFEQAAEIALDMYLSQHPRT